MLTPSQTRRRILIAQLALAALLVTSASSCKLTQAALNAPGKVVSGVSGSPKPPEPVAPAVVQMEVMRFADSFAAEVVKATEEFASNAGTPEARIQGLTWAVRQATAAYTIAAGKNANTNLLDMVVLATLGRAAHEDYWMPKVWHEADLPMVTAYRKLEDDAWKVVAQILTPTQVEQVRATLTEWREKNPIEATSMFVRLPAFQDMLASRGKSQNGVFTELGNMISIDPLSGLEPATREVEQARMLGERTMYYLQRAQLVVPMQMELLALQTMRMPDAQAALADTQRVSKAAESIAETAAKLPESVRVEREAAVKQIADELTAQRQGLVADLEHAQEPAQKLLTQAQATLTAGEHMSTALQGALGTLDTFVGRFDKPEPAGAPAPPPSSEPKPAGKPFDIAEYGTACEKLGAAARDLNGLVTDLDKNMPQLQRVLGEAAQRGDETIDHVYSRGLTLGATLIALAALAALGVRWISSRWLRAAR